MDIYSHNERIPVSTNKLNMLLVTLIACLILSTGYRSLLLKFIEYERAQYRIETVRLWPRERLCEFPSLATATVGHFFFSNLFYIVPTHNHFP